MGYNQHNQKYNYNLDVFYEPSAISYYLLGAFMTDGNVRSRPNRKQVKLNSEDIDWLELIRDLICKELPIKVWGNCGELYIHSTELGNWLILKGCTPNKSLTLKFPEVPEKYLPDFIRGCMDGDGSVNLYPNKRYPNYYQKSSYFCTASEDFVNAFESMLNARAIAYYSEKREPSETRKPSFIRGRAVIHKNTYYRTTIAAKSLVDFLSWVYYSGNPIAMPRKEKNANSIVTMKKLAIK